MQQPAIGKVKQQPAIGRVEQLPYIPNHQCATYTDGCAYSSTPLNKARCTIPTVSFTLVRKQTTTCFCPTTTTHCVHACTPAHYAVHPTPSVAHVGMACHSQLDGMHKRETHKLMCARNGASTNKLHTNHSMREICMRTAQDPATIYKYSPQCRHN